MNKLVKIIAAIDKSNGIGLNNNLPWKLPNELKEFQRITKTVIDKNKQNCVIMGRKTWDSMGNKALKDRYNIIITSNKNYYNNSATIGSLPTKEGSDNTVFNDDIKDAINHAKENPLIESIFIIGGEDIYRNSLPLSDELIITHLKKKYECDRHFPDILQKDWIISHVDPLVKEYDSVGCIHPPHNTDVSYERIYYRRLRELYHGEQQYLDILWNVLQTGVKRDDRTGVGTLSNFGVQMRFNLEGNHIPLLTTKTVAFRVVCEEILWMLRGSTNVRELQDKNVHIWDGNTSRDFLDKRGLSLEEGDIGPTYGFLMRHFGATYGSFRDDYSGKGVDQVSECLRLIREDPTSRRIIMTLWNPDQIDKAALPPCACFYQWYVADGKLSCSLYQRSGDLMLGIPFNMVSATIITRIFAKICGLEVGELIHTIGDAHIYMNHIEGAKEQVQRKPRPFPIMEIRDGIYKDVNEFKYEDFTVKGYVPYDTIKLPMAV